MIKQRLQADLKKTVELLGFEIDDVVLSISQKKEFGDYSSNIPLQLAKQNLKNSNQKAQEIANQLSDKLGDLDYLEKVEVGGNGFLNFFIKDEFLIKDLEDSGTKLIPVESQKILVEYGHVNLLKEVHIGHLRTFILGESIAQILSAIGNTVFRANYQGDIGPHIAKAIWGMRKLGIPFVELSAEEKGNYLGRAYAEGNRAYEEDPDSKIEVDEINIELYRNDSSVIADYRLARGWSLEYLEPIYNKLKIKYDRCFFESEVAEEGKKTVLKNLGAVFEESQGAIIFPGEKYGLHNQVFITHAGNPTYEAKEIGLAKLEFEVFPYDKAIHVVASEQSGYFNVIFKAIDLVFPHLKDKKFHLSYGFVDLKEGKMSSRTGEIISFDDLYSKVSSKVEALIKSSKEETSNVGLVDIVTMGAIKFAYLKLSPTPNMTFDLEASISLQGDSGPYVQYTYARANSVVSASPPNLSKNPQISIKLTDQERQILLSLAEFDSVINQAAKALRPNLITEHLLKLSHQFNLFYQLERILNSETEEFRLLLTKSVSETLKTGLGLLGIEAPERM